MTCAAESRFATVVGYQQLEVPGAKAWTLYTPTFKGIATELKMSDIVVCNADGVEFDDNQGTARSGRCRGKVAAYKMDTVTGTLGDGMAYTSAGWQNRTTTAVETWGWGAYRNVSIGSNECLIVYNTDALVKFQVSGEVELHPQVEVPGNKTWAIIGNNTPVDRVLGDFMLCNAQGIEFDDNQSEARSGRCRGKVAAYKMDPVAGTLGDGMAYTSAGWQNRETTAKETWGWGAYRNVPVNAGEALIIYNTDANPVQFKVKGPLE